MQTHRLLLLTCALFALGTACAPRQPAPEFRTTATIKDIMESIVDPNADYLWESVSTVATLKGTVENAPKTDKDWAEERHHAITLLEATNLLQIPGRLVAQRGEKSANPGIEESPEAIQEMLDGDRASWINYAHGLHDATTLMLKAIDAKDVTGVLNAGEDLDKACENCHKHYWYPHQFDNIQKSPGSMKPGGSAPKAP